MDSDLLVSLIDSMTPIQKSRIYGHYYCTTIALKYRFEAVYKDRFLLEYTAKDNKGLAWDRGYGTPDKEYLGLAFYYLWKDIEIISQVDFFSNTNIRITDHGEKWKEAGFAQRIRTDYSGAYQWYSKFKEELNNTLG